MQGRLLKKGHGILCSEDEKDSLLTLHKEEEEIVSMLSRMSESILSRVLTATCACDVWVSLQTLHR